MSLVGAIKCLNPIRFVSSLVAPGNPVHKIVKIVGVSVAFFTVSLGGTSVMTYHYLSQLQKYNLSSHSSTLNNMYNTSAEVKTYSIVPDRGNNKNIGSSDVYSGSVNASEKQVIQAVNEILGQDLTYGYFLQHLKEANSLTSREKHNMYSLLIPSICSYLKFNLFPALTIGEANTETSFGTAVPETYNWWGLRSGSRKNSYWSGAVWPWGAPYNYCKFNNMYNAVMYHAWFFTQSNYGPTRPGGGNWLHLPSKDLDVLKQPTLQTQVRALASSPYDDDGNSEVTYHMDGMIVNNYYVSTMNTIHRYGFDYWDTLAEAIKNKLGGLPSDNNLGGGSDSAGSQQSTPTQNNNNNSSNSESKPIAIGTIKQLDGHKVGYIAWGLIAPVPYYTIDGHPWGEDNSTNENLGGGLQFNSVDKDAKSGWHSGYDFDAPTGTPVVASANGTIKYAASIGPGYKYYLDQQNPPNGQPTISYGRVVFESVAGGQVEILYAHLHKFIVHDGEQVKQGQVIGYLGAAGNATGPHVHFEIRDLVNNTCLNPMADNNLKKDMMSCQHFYGDPKFGVPNIAN